MGAGALPAGSRAGAAPAFCLARLAAAGARVDPGGVALLWLVFAAGADDLRALLRRLATLPVQQPAARGAAGHVPDFRLLLAARSISILSPVFLYWQMNYHTEHHMYAGVPCYNLPKLHRLIKPQMPACKRGLLPRGSRFSRSCATEGRPGLSARSRPAHARADLRIAVRRGGRFPRWRRQERNARLCA